MLESRLSTCQNYQIEGYDMQFILSRIKRLIQQFEAISPNYYDGLIMQCLGGF